MPSARPNTSRQLEEKAALELFRHKVCSGEEHGPLLAEIEKLSGGVANLFQAEGSKPASRGAHTPETD